MLLAYIDETGDDGFPEYASPLFVLTAVYLPVQNWKRDFTLIRNYRRELFARFKFPTDWEFHTSKVVLNKKPYTQLNLSPEDRLEMMNGFFNLLTQTSARILNVVINKTVIRKPDYPVLETAVTYMVQRIENDLIRNFDSANFMVVIDEGREKAMRKSIRKMQAINYIPSLYTPGGAYRKEIGLLVEDPVVKNSQASFFIQLSDLVGFVVYQYMIMKLGIGQGHNRLQQVADFQQLENWLKIIKPCLNLEADRKQKHGFGIVCYPNP